LDKPDTITVNVELEQKIYASRADMYVEIRGDSFVSGNAALNKAREVRDLVAALAELGVEESSIQVVGIRAEVSSGIIGKSSSAVYRLRIGIPCLDVLADSLGAVTSRKNATLTVLDWQYDGIEELHNDMLAQALQRAQERAALICRELGHQNLGVHTLTEKLRDDQEKQARHYARAMLSDVSVGVRRRGAVTKEDLGLDVSHAKTVSLDVRVEYRVKPQPEAEQRHAADG
jgi:uncharacterized protein YggE